jgi:uncharacterized membrane protein
MAENTTPPEAPAPQSTTQQTQTAAPAPHPAGPTNGLAIAALVVGIVAIISGWIPFWGLIVGIAAIVLGILGLRKAGGKGMAIAGLVTGALGALWGLVITAFVIIALVVGSPLTTERSNMNSTDRQQQSTADGKKEFAKGETANFADTFEVKVNSSEMNFSPASFYTPDEGKQFIRVNLTVTNISDESKYVSGLNFGVIDNGLKTGSSLVIVANQLPNGELEPGATITGNVVYQVSLDATDLKLAYESTTYNQAYKMQKTSYTLAF